jgi:hypothetical protein
MFVFLKKFTGLCQINRIETPYVKKEKFSDDCYDDCGNIFEIEKVYKLQKEELEQHV